jgi:hypothetical protein
VANDKTAQGGRQPRIARIARPCPVRLRHNYGGFRQTLLAVSFLDLRQGWTLRPAIRFARD